MSYVNKPVTFQVIPEKELLDALPGYFKNHFSIVEISVYAWLTKLSKDYDGGFWEFYSLSNGGFYMAPVLESELHLKYPSNNFAASMSADAAGIVACLFALSHISCSTGTDLLAERFHQLREYALDHHEAEKIFALIA